MAVKQFHPKIQELRQQAKAINYSAVSVSDFGELVDTASGLKDRIVKGYLCLWNKRSQMGRMYLKGSCAKSIREHGPDSGSNYKIKFLNQHDPADPLALFAVLKEDETGLYFETKPLDDIPSANRVLTQLASGTLNNFSHGWNIIWDKVEYDDKTDTIIFAEMEVLEGSVVSIPDELETFMAAGLPGADNDVTEQTEYFIEQLPRTLRLQARHLLNLHASLGQSKPSAGLLPETLAKNEPSGGRKIDYAYLINNLNF